MMTKIIWTEFNQELLGFIKSRIHNAEDAKDILQDVFIKIHKKISSLQDHKKMTSWVYQITRNSIIDHYRKKRINTMVGRDGIWETLSEEVVTPTTDFTKCLRPFISRLPEKYRDIILQTTFGNLSVKDYAIKNSLSYAATKSRIQRARKLLKEMFIQCCKSVREEHTNIFPSKNKKNYC